MKRPSFRRKRTPVLPTRITNETVAEHRERILAGGRRFKYPMQYARHRLVITTILLTVAILAAFVVVGWQQLYLAQNTSTFFYRVTRIVPVPVASVDGTQVRYSDYLMYLNSSLHYLRDFEQVNLNNREGQVQVAIQKRRNLDSAIRNAYAAKLARELHIKVTPEQLKRANDNHLNAANGRISQETYNAATLNVLGWAPDEEQLATKYQLLKDNVAFAIDTTAKQTTDKAAQLIQKDGGDFDKVAAELGGEGSAKVTAGVSGFVPLGNSDGGRTEIASKLQKGQVSQVFRSTAGDAYYFVKLLDQNDGQINYAFLSVPLTEFDKRIADLRKAGKIHEYIKVPDATAQQTANQ